MKKGTTAHPEIFMALAQAYESGNTIITDRIESILAPNDVSLPETLQLALDKFGDTPITEPLLYGALQGGSMDEFATMCSIGLDLDAVDAVVAGTFIARVRTKILLDVDKDGVFKTTPALEPMRLPKLSEVRSFADTAQGRPEEELQVEVLRLVGLENAELSAWEKELVRNIVIAYTHATTEALLGRATDKTPFARYLKNK